MSARSELIEKLKNKKYRSAYIRSQIDVGIPMQIKFLRENLGWTQGALGKKAGMKQPRISAMEHPGEVSFNLETLIRIASAFDVGLVVRFAPYSEMLRLESQFNPNTFTIPNFGNDTGLLPPEAMPAPEPICAMLVQKTQQLTSGDAGSPMLPSDCEAVVSQSIVPRTSGMADMAHVAILNQDAVSSPANIV